MDLKFLQVDIFNEEHSRQLIQLLDFYMQDEMGNNAPMPVGLAPEIIDGLKNHPAYLGFFALADGRFAALANCNKCFSTFKAKTLINVHDFIVFPEYRGKGVGAYLLDCIFNYGVKNNFCRINLEVRNDNLKAQNLYAKSGFRDCSPRMLFWECDL